MRTVDCPIQQVAAHLNAARNTLDTYNRAQV